MLDFTGGVKDEISIKETVDEVICKLRKGIYHERENGQTFKMLIWTRIFSNMEITVNLKRDSAHGSLDPPGLRTKPSVGTPRGRARLRLWGPAAALRS